MLCVTDPRYVTRCRKPSISQDDEKKMSKNRSEAYEPKWIRFYRNGDPFFLGKQLVITKKKYPSLEALLSELTTTLNLQHGAVRRVYTPTKGTRIKFLHQLIDKHEYVVSSGEKFKPLPQGYQSVKSSALPLLSKTKLSQGGRRRKESTNLRKAASYPDSTFTKHKNTITISVLEDDSKKEELPKRVTLNLEVDWKHSLERIANTLRQHFSPPKGLYTVDGHLTDQFTIKDGELYYLVRELQEHRNKHQPASLNRLHSSKTLSGKEENQSFLETVVSNVIDVQNQGSLIDNHSRTEEEPVNKLNEHLRPSSESPHSSIRGLFNDEKDDPYNSETDVINSTALHHEDEEGPRLTTEHEIQKPPAVDSFRGTVPELGRLSTDSAYRSGSSTGQRRPDSILNKRGTHESLFYAKDEDEGSLLPRYLDARETIFRANTSDGREAGALDVPEGSDIKVELDVSHRPVLEVEEEC